MSAQYLNVVFVSKPVSLAEVRHWTTQAAPHERVRVHIAETLRLSPAAYDALTESFTTSRDEFRGKGGTDACLLIHAPGRPSLVIDPQGYDYARYVALA